MNLFIYELQHFKKFDRSNYLSNPFPHFIIHDALDYKEYLELESEYEKIDLGFIIFINDLFFSKKSNKIVFLTFFFFYN